MNFNKLNIWLVFLFYLIVLNSQTSGQFRDVNSGGYIGIGSIKGNSPSQTSISGSVSIGFNHTLLNEIGIRIKYLFAKKATYFLPENSEGRYYPFIHSIAIEAVIDQPLGNTLFVEEGLGLVTINDRTFSDVDQWDYGFIATIFIGWDHRKADRSGIKFGFIGESALTFTSTSAAFAMIGFQVLNYF